jgi:hypothetical protein
MNIQILKPDLKKFQYNIFVDKLAKHSLCSLVRKYYFLTSDSIAIFAHYFQFAKTPISCSAAP